MKKMLELGFGIFKGWKRSLIFHSLGIFALFTIIKFLYFLVDKQISVYEVYKITVVSLLIFIGSFIVYISAPQKFPCWNINYAIKLLKKKLKYGIQNIFDLIDIARIIILISPISKILKSIGLAVFILTFVEVNINSLWQSIYVESYEIYKFLGILFVIPFAVFISIFLLELFTKFIDKKYKIGFVRHIIMLIWIISLSIIIVILAGTGNEFPLILELNKIIITTSILSVKFIVGFIPIGWFYELFISSFIKQDKFL